MIEKIKKIFILFFFVLVSINVFSNIKILSVTGTVRYKTTPEGQWLPVQIGGILQQNYLLFTGFDSTAVLEYNNIKIEVKPLTQLGVKDLFADKENQVTDIYLKYGKIKADVVKSDDVQTSFKVRSANSTASVRGTRFSFGDDFLFVEEGTVLLVSDNMQSVLVQRNEKAYATEFDYMKSPHDTIFKDFYVNTNPMGLSDSEEGNDVKISSKQGQTKKGQLIITINISN